MGSLMEDVVTCKKTLEEAASSEEQVIDALKLLSSTPVTKQLLTKTLIGKTVNKLGMKHKSSAVKSLAKDLVAKWREVAGTPMSTPKSCASTAKIPFNVMSVGVISKASDYPAATRSSVEHWFWEYT